jgi:cytochrome c-type biogenesis protein CcmH/NrfG
MSEPGPTPTSTDLGATQGPLDPERHPEPDGGGGTDERALYTERRARAIRDLVETQQQLDSGEIDGETADRLMAIYQAEVVSALEGLDGLGVEPAPTTKPNPNRHRLIAGAGIMAAAIIAVAVLVTRSPTPRQPGQFATGNAPVTQPGGGRDLSTVSNEEMEQVIAQNPNVIPMRLALAERYLGDGNFQKASEHAHVALQQNPGATDKARALRDLGWATALMDKPTEGADLLQQSLQLEPSDQNTMFFLAKVRLDGLHDAPGAITLLQQLLGTDITDPDVKKTVEDTLAQARAQASGQAPPTTSKP